MQIVLQLNSGCKWVCFNMKLLQSNSLFSKMAYLQQHIGRELGRAELPSHSRTASSIASLPARRSRRSVISAATTSRPPRLPNVGNIKDIRELQLLDGDQDMDLMDPEKMRNVKVGSELSTRCFSGVPACCTGAGWLG